MLAMWEGGSATALDPETLETRGLVTWAPELKSMPFSAHPKIEADGTFWNFGTLMNKMVLYHISASGTLLRHAVFEAPPGSMVHDFAVSQKHIVFVLPPIGMDYQAMRDGKGIGQAMIWNDKAPTKVLVVDKADFSKRRILELPAARVVHKASEANVDPSLSLRNVTDIFFADGPQEKGLLTVAQLLVGRLVLEFDEAVRFGAVDQIRKIGVLCYN